MTFSRPPSREDIVVFTAPGGMVMVKRVVALPGAEVVLSAGTIAVDGVARDDVVGTPGAGHWALSSEEYFVLSDAPDLTMSDSRTFGPIHASSLLGTVKYRYWPPVRVGRPTGERSTATSW